MHELEIRNLNWKGYDDLHVYSYHLFLCPSWLEVLEHLGVTKNIAPTPCMAIETIQWKFNVDLDVQLYYLYLCTYLSLIHI